MGSRELSSQQSKNQIATPSVNDKKGDLEYINETFKVGSVVTQLHSMMGEVVKGGYDAKNVNAACNCISQLNQTINTAISAARFLRES